MLSDKRFVGAREPFCCLSALLLSTGTRRRPDGSGKNRLNRQTMVDRQPLTAGDFQPV